MLKIPKNKIQEGKYTAGGEFIVKETNAPYQGYYYTLNNTLYTGKSYNPSASVLIPLQERNTLYQNPLTAIYSAITNITSQQLQSPKINSIPNSTYIAPGDTTPRFYCRQINIQPIIIKEINEDNYKFLQNNSLYQTTYIGIYNNKPQSIEEANKQIPGLKSFLGL